MRILAREYTDSGLAGCRPQEVRCVQRAGGPGTASRYVILATIGSFWETFEKLMGLFVTRQGSKNTRTGRQYRNCMWTRISLVAAIS